MHNNVVGILLNINKKTKDTNKAQMELQDLNIKKELQLVKHGIRYIKQHAKYTFRC